MDALFGGHLDRLINPDRLCNRCKILQNLKWKPKCDLPRPVPPAAPELLRVAAAAAPAAAAAAAGRLRAAVGVVLGAVRRRRRQQGSTVTLVIRMYSRIWVGLFQLIFSTRRIRAGLGILHLPEI